MHQLISSACRVALALAITALSTQLLPVHAQEAQPSAAAHTFVIGPDSFLLDGKPFVIRCGEIHSPRVPREYWQQRLKMCHAMGLNTVCVYLFWNYYEPEEGKFNWSGQADVAEFCREAQAEGLWVILRPGPYSCAEWEMGGLPWWLLKNDQIKLRTSDPLYLGPATTYLKEVGRVLGPLQVTHGGPILMVQVENEYGSFGKDADYMGKLRQAMIDAGFDVPLFACNPAGAIKNGYRDDLFQVVNFGPGSAEGAFNTLRQFQKTGPLMNGEFYPGWFDTWGRAHQDKPIDRAISDLSFMLDHGYSFSIYMAHGGTTFGLWSGADQPFKPDTSSYDYNAPISEAGWATDKFTQIRELFLQHLQPGETIPDPLPDNPVIEVPSFALNEVAPIRDNLPAPVATDDQPKTMEAYDQGHGCILYRTTLPAGAAGTIAATDLHDFAWISLDGTQVGVMDRRTKQFQVKVPARTAPAQLDILVEAMGRVNFGQGIHDRKGLYAPVTFTPEQGDAGNLSGWQVFSLPLDAAELASLKFQPAPATGPAFWRGSFDLAQPPGDTFLDLRTWGKGVAWVNGHCLGRFWNIGPTQTLYCPGPWLVAGKNEVVLLDLVGPADPHLTGLAKPILSELHLEHDLARHVAPGGTFDAGGQLPAAAGSFTPEVAWQEAKFGAPVKGRYLCFEALNAHDGKPIAAGAELTATDANGQVIPNASWKILWVDSEDTARGGDAANILDGQSSSAWQTARGDYPHRIVIDLGASQTISGLRYLPKEGKPDDPGRIKDYRVYVSDQPFGLAASN
jgi:beta-galactosidase